MLGTVKSIRPTTDNKGNWIAIDTQDGKFSALAESNINISALKVGSKADFVLEAKPKKDGTGNWHKIKSFAFEGGEPIGSVNTPVAKNGLSEPELRFVSNCVGNAITAQMIVKPSEIGLWAKHALIALKNINQPINDLNDDLEDVR